MENLINEINEIFQNDLNLKIKISKRENILVIRTPSKEVLIQLPRIIGAASFGKSFKG